MLEPCLLPSWVDVPATPPDLSALKRAIELKHTALVSSQAALRDALRVEWDDELNLAVTENVPIIVRFEVQLQQLDELLHCLTTAAQAGSTAVIIPERSWTSELQARADAARAARGKAPLAPCASAATATMSANVAAGVPVSAASEDSESGVYL